MIADKNRTQVFIRTIIQYYKRNRRDLPWRKTRDPYKILSSLKHH